MEKEPQRRTENKPRERPAGTFTLGLGNSQTPGLRKGRKGTPAAKSKDIPWTKEVDYVWRKKQ